MTEDLRIGHPIIDTDHQRLFDIINNFNTLSVSLSNETRMHETLKALYRYGEEHFQREQKIQIDCGYPYCSTHAAEHKKLSDEIAGIATDFFIKKSKPLDRDAIKFLNQFLEDWIIRHVKKVDMTMEHYVVTTMSSGGDGGSAVERFASLDMVALVVDAGAASRDMLCRTLIRMGVTIVLEADGIVDGMKKCMGDPAPDFLVIGSGLEFQKFIGTLRSTQAAYVAALPAILAIDPADRVAEDVAAACGMQGAFLKTQTAQEISQAIRRCLA